MVQRVGHVLKLSDRTVHVSFLVSTGNLGVNSNEMAAISWKRIKYQFSFARS